MKRLSLALLATLALGGAALAEDKAAPPSSPGSEVKKDDQGKMKGPPNASGFEKKDAGSSTSGSTSGTSKPQ